MSDARLDALADSARNRGLKLVRSRVRTPGKRRFGKVGLTDSAGKPVFGLDSKGPAAKPEEVEEYLRTLAGRDWGASLSARGAPRTRSRKAPPAASSDSPPRPRAPARRPKPDKPPPEPTIREARPADSPRLVELIVELGYRTDERSVRRSLAALKRAGELPLVAAVGKDVVGLCGLHRMTAIHRAKPVGRVNILIVTESARGRGLGRMLLEKAEQRLAGLGCGLIEITVGDARSEAQAFYRHLGYERSSIRYFKDLG